MEDAERSNSIDSALAVWRRRKRLAIPTVCAGLAVAVSIAIFLPNVYSAGAKVLIERQQIPETMVQSTVTGEVMARVQTITQEILSYSRLESLITRFDLYPESRGQVPMERIIERMRRDIRVELKQVAREGNDFVSGTFTISFSGNDPQKLAQGVNALASFYAEENLKIRERQAIGTSQFFQVQQEEVKVKLDEQEQRVSEFKERYIGDLPQQQEANLATLRQLNERLRVNSDTQMRIGERREMLARQLAEVEGFNTASGPDAAARIAQLNQELMQLQTRFSNKYPDVIRLKAEIAALGERLHSAKTNKVSGEKERQAPASPYALQLKQAISEVDLEIKALKAEAEDLRHSIVTYQRRIEQAPRRELEFRMLARDYEVTRDLYHSLLKRQEEAQLAEKMEQREKGEQLRILESATPPREPVKPNRSRLILMGLLLSLGVAAGVVVLAEQLDTSVHTVDDLRSFSRVPVLVSIPRIVTEADLSRRRWQFCFEAAAAIVGVVLIVSSSYLVAKGRAPLVGEFVRSQLLRL